MLHSADKAPFRFPFFRRAYRRLDAVGKALKKGLRFFIDIVEEEKASAQSHIIHPQSVRGGGRFHQYGAAARVLRYQGVDHRSRARSVDHHLQGVQLYRPGQNRKSGVFPIRRVSDAIIRTEQIPRLKGSPA